MTTEASMKASTIRALSRALATWGLLILPGVVAAQHDHGHHDPAEPDAHAHHRAPRGATVEYRTEEGLSIPDIPVVTQDGREVRFFQDLVEGKVVAMNFVFTTCTTICPPLGASFGKLQEELGEKIGRDVHLISVSVDPLTDTPERLKAWGEIFGAGPGWTLVTGDKDEVTQLLKALQVFTPDIRDHSPVVLAGNAATEAWTRAYGLAPPKELAEILGDLAAGETAPGGPR